MPRKVDKNNIFFTINVCIIIRHEIENDEKDSGYLKDEEVFQIDLYYL